MKNKIKIGLIATLFFGFGLTRLDSQCLVSYNGCMAGADMSRLGCLSYGGSASVCNSAWNLATDGCAGLYFMCVDQL
jgi:hypothetical protein